MNEIANIGKNILNTVIYYDILDYPLTSFEIWKYLLSVNNDQGTVINEKNKSFTLGQVVEELDTEKLKRHIEEHNGFYFLKSRENLVQKRIERDKNSIEKYKIAAGVAWWLRFVPFVRLAAVTGTVAMKNCEKGSDIDFFVILEKGRIFTGRLLATALVHLLGKRRHGKKIKNKVCLNYFVTTASLEIEKKNLFAANEYSFLYPLSGFDVYQKFGEANIEWIKKFKPNYSFDELEPFRCVEDTNSTRTVRKMLENLINLFMGDIIEIRQKRKQTARIERNPLTKKEGAYIRATDENLIFLPEPQGPNIRERYEVLTGDL